MQDTQTGALVPVSSLTQQDLDAKLPRSRQGATFYQGEEVRLKGGLFAVHSIGREMLTLRGLPGTRKPQLALKTAHQSAADCVLAILNQIEALPANARRQLGIKPEDKLEDILARAFALVELLTREEEPSGATPPTGTIITIGQAH